MNRRIWGKFGLLVLLTTIISSAITILIWGLAGNKFTFKGKYLDIDFFNLLCATFGIVGLLITLFQISALRTIQKIKIDTTEQTRLEDFKNEAIRKFGVLHEQLKILQETIISSISYTHPSVSGYVIQINGFVNTLNDLKIRQAGLTNTPKINCENCLTLLGKVEAVLHQIMADNDYGNFKKQEISESIREVINEIIQCQTKIK